MDLHSRKLLLTRPLAQSRKFLEDYRAAGASSVVAIISPVLQITSVEHDVDLDRYNCVIVTSSNALSHLNADLSERMVWTVGLRTAERARNMGAKAECLGETVEEFLKHADMSLGHAIHVRGVHSRGDLAARLTAMDVPTDEVVVYDQRENRLTPEAQLALRSGNALVPVFSPRSARLLSSYPCHAATQVVAISEATAHDWRGPGRVVIAEKPSSAQVISSVIQAL